MINETLYGFLSLCILYLTITMNASANEAMPIRAAYKSNCPALLVLTHPQHTALSVQLRYRPPSCARISVMTYPAVSVGERTVRNPISGGPSQSPGH